MCQTKDIPDVIRVSQLTPMQEALLGQMLKGAMSAQKGFVFGMPYMGPYFSSYGSPFAWGAPPRTKPKPKPEPPGPEPPPPPPPGPEPPGPEPPGPEPPGPEPPMVTTPRRRNIPKPRDLALPPWYEILKTQG